MTSPNSSPGPQSYPGHCVVHVRHTGMRSELDVAEQMFGSAGKVLSDVEGRINVACQESVMKQANKMKPNETTEMQLRVVLRPGYRVRPSHFYLSLL